MRRILIIASLHLILQLLSVVSAKPPYDDNRGTIIYESSDTGCVWDELYPVPKHVVYFDSCTTENSCDILPSPGFVIYDYLYCEFFEILVGENAGITNNLDFLIHSITPNGNKAVFVFESDICGGGGSTSVYFIRSDSTQGITLQKLDFSDGFDWSELTGNPWRINADNSVTLIDASFVFIGDTLQAETKMYDVFTIYYNESADSIAVR